MTKEIKKDKFYYTTCILILSAVVIILLAYIFFFTMLSKSVQNQLGWESTSNAIALVGLITSVITIVFVYKTYKAQRRELDERREKDEYNRVIDFIYKQLQYTKNALSNPKYQDIYNRLWINFIINNYRLNKKILEDWNIDGRLDCNIYFEFLESELIPYRLMIESADISIENKVIFGKVIASNLSEDFTKVLQKFVETSERFISEPAFKKNSEEGQSYRRTNLRIAKEVLTLVKPK